MSSIAEDNPDDPERWLTPGVRGIGAASLLSDAGHEIPTSLLPAFLTSTLGAPASALGLIEGISDGFIPAIYARHRTLVDATISISSEDAVAQMRALAREHGLLCGPSSGAHLLAARRIRSQYPELQTVLTILDDEGEKYLHDFHMQRVPPSPRVNAVGRGSARRGDGRETPPPGHRRARPVANPEPV